MKIILVTALLVGGVAAYAENAGAEPGPCGPNVDRCDPPEFLCYGWPPNDPVERAEWLVSCVSEGFALPGLPIVP